jgi:nucleotide-binding universal stress UspA family protein
MTEQNPHPVVVAVGHDPVDAALAYAAREAARFGCGLHLVHAVHLIPSGPEMVLVDVTDIERIGRQTLNGAVERAQDLAGEGMQVTSEMVLGGVVPSLVDAAADARMIVLQHRDLSRMRRVVTRSITSGVAAHARVPVVSVPSSWSAARVHGAPTVTVGVDLPDRCEEVLRTAGAAARRQGATLRVLHTWSFPSAYDDIIMSRVEHDEWGARASAEIQAVLDGLGDVVAGVPVEIEARHVQAADALIEASRTADLLVVGRHDPLVPIGSHLGPVARAVLREAECPVLLADPRPAHRWVRHHDKESAVQHG